MCLQCQKGAMVETVKSIVMVKRYQQPRRLVLRDLLMGLEFLYRQQSLLTISCFLQRRNEPPLSYPDNLTQKFGLTLVRVAKSITRQWFTIKQIASKSISISISLHLHRPMKCPNGFTNEEERKSFSALLFH